MSCRSVGQRARSLRAITAVCSICPADGPLFAAFETSSSASLRFHLATRSGAQTFHDAIVDGALHPRQAWWQVVRHFSARTPVELHSNLSMVSCSGSLQLQVTSLPCAPRLVRPIEHRIASPPILFPASLLLQAFRLLASRMGGRMHVIEAWMELLVLLACCPALVWRARV